MIIYNVGNRFFEKKADADSHRRAIKLDKSQLHKISINDREGLARFLNGLCDREAQSTVSPVKAQVRDDIPDFVPDFIRKDWERREAMGKQS